MEIPADLQALGEASLRAELGDKTVRKFPGWSVAVSCYNIEQDLGCPKYLCRIAVSDLKEVLE